MPKPNLRSFRPNLTQLESREVPAVVSAQLTGGIVTVRTDNESTNILVNQTAAAVVVQDVTSNRVWTFSPSSVGRVDVFGGNGADTFYSRGPANGKLVRLFGQGGKDTLVGGVGREFLSGGGGHDVLKGAGGNDTLNGDAGNDSLNGGAGRDALGGGAGNDWMNGGAGKDNMKGGAGEDTLISIDAAGTDTLDAGVGFDILWVDQVSTGNDTVEPSDGGDTLHTIDGFDNAGADLTLDGDRIADPAPLPGDSYERFANRPLFSSEGPQYTDITQGALSDCWLLAGLGSTAMVNPNAIRERVVDFGDGTYGVQLGDFYYRVDSDLVVDDPGLSSSNYSSLGHQASLWVSVMEKAYTHFRIDGANSFPSIEWGNSVDVFRQAFESTDAQQIFFNFSDTAPMTETRATAIIKEMMNGTISPTLGIFAIVPGLPLLTSHQYIMVDYTTSGPEGLVETITLYNPWGRDGMPTGDGKEYDGLVTITLETLVYQIAGVFEYATVQ